MTDAGLAPRRNHPAGMTMRRTGQTRPREFSDVSVMPRSMWEPLFSETARGRFTTCNEPRFAGRPPSDRSAAVESRADPHERVRRAPDLKPRVLQTCARRFR